MLLGHNGLLRVISRFGADGAHSEWPVIVETVDDLPGLRRVKRWVVIRAQKRRLSQLPEDRGLMSLSEVVQELVDSGVQPDLEQATWLVYRTFRKEELADGRAWQIFDGYEHDFWARDLIPLECSRAEGEPPYGGTGEFIRHSDAQLREHLLNNLSRSSGAMVHVSGVEIDRLSADAGWGDTQGSFDCRGGQRRPVGAGYPGRYRTFTTGIRRADPLGNFACIFPCQGMRNEAAEPHRNRKTGSAVARA